MTIGMLGGSFCPPTTAHLELSKKCIEKGLCDKVIWVPVNDAYKKATNIPAKHRVEMVKLAIQPYDFMEFSDFEQKAAKVRDELNLGFDEETYNKLYPYLKLSD